MKRYLSLEEEILINAGCIDLYEAKWGNEGVGDEPTKDSIQSYNDAIDNMLDRIEKGERNFTIRTNLSFTHKIGNKQEVSTVFVSVGISDNDTKHEAFGVLHLWKHIDEYKNVLNNIDEDLHNYLEENGFDFSEEPIKQVLKLVPYAIKPTNKQYHRFKTVFEKVAIVFAGFVFVLCVKNKTNNDFTFVLTIYPCDEETKKNLQNQDREVIKRYKR